jgi:hypothetical protein
MKDVAGIQKRTIAAGLGIGLAAGAVLGGALMRAGDDGGQRGREISNLEETTTTGEASSSSTTSIVVVTETTAMPPASTPTFQVGTGTPIDQRVGELEDRVGVLEDTTTTSTSVPAPPPPPTTQACRGLGSPQSVNPSCPGYEPPD